MQTGKQESRPVFEAVGFHFMDLNELAEYYRREHLSQYRRLGLSDGILSDGRKSSVYYQVILSQPGLHQAVMEIELPAVATMALEQLESAAGPIVVNWGYLYKILSQFTYDRVFLFQTKREVWLERIRRRAIQAGWPGDGPSEEAILNLARVIEMEPAVIEQSLCASTDYTVIDTSPDDWGRANLMAALKQIA